MPARDAEVWIRMAKEDVLRKVSEQNKKIKREDKKDKYMFDANENCCRLPEYGSTELCMDQQAKVRGRGGELYKKKNKMEGKAVQKSKHPRFTERNDS